MEQLRAMFPDAAEADVRTALQAAGGDPAAAIDFLLHPASAAGPGGGGGGGGGGSGGGGSGGAYPAPAYPPPADLQRLQQQQHAAQFQSGYAQPQSAAAGAPVAAAAYPGMAYGLQSQPPPQQQSRPPPQQQNPQQYPAQVPLPEAPPSEAGSKEQQWEQVVAWGSSKGVDMNDGAAAKEHFRQHPFHWLELQGVLRGMGLGHLKPQQVYGYFMPVIAAKRQSGTVLADVMRVPQRPRVYNFNASVTEDQRETFRQHGFVVCPNVVPHDVVHGALRVINASLGRGFTQEQIATFVKKTWAPEVSTSPTLLDLLYLSPALALAQSLIGPVKSVHAGQIALRHPGVGCVRPEQLDRWLPPSGADEYNRFVPVPDFHRWWHVDGLSDKLASHAGNAAQHVRGVMDDTAFGRANNFTMLLGVFLSAVPDDFFGNLTVFPGSHRVLENVFRQHGGAANFLANHAHPTALESLRKATEPHLGPHVQVCGQPGDIVMVHYSMAHCVAPNTSSGIRYVVYFRLRHARGESNFRPEAMDDVWLEYDHVRGWDA